MRPFSCYELNYNKYIIIGVSCTNAILLNLLEDAKFKMLVSMGI